mgnify:CR=1 FL=1
MPELLEKLYQIKHQKEFSLEDLKNQIDAIPKVDNESIMNAINNTVLNILSRHYEIEASGRENLASNINSQLSSSIASLASASEKSYRNVISSLENAATKLEQAIKSIPETDLSGLDAAIKGIKPTDVSELQNDIKALSQAVVALKNKKPPKQQKIDLTPVINAIKTPMKVEFEIEYDSWDYPIKVIATVVK